MGTNIATNVPFAPANDRRLRDYNYIANVSLPAAAGQTNTPNIDLMQPQWQSGQTAPKSGAAGPYPVTERFWVNVRLTAVSTGGANNKNVNVTLQHADAYAANGLCNNLNYANIATLATPLLMLYDLTTAGQVGNSTNVMLPPTVKRFIRGQSTLEALGGDASSGTLTVQACF